MTEPEGRSAFVAEAEQYRIKLRKQIDQLQIELKALEQFLAARRDKDSTPTAGAETHGPYRDMGLQQAVNALLQSQPNHWFQAKEVETTLRRGGFVANKTFRPQIFSALNRAVRNKRKRTASREKHNGKVVFRYLNPATVEKGEKAGSAVGATTTEPQ